MTLCISAECVHEYEPAAVLCFDWRAQTGDPTTGMLVGTDDAYKLREVGSASVLLAGGRTMADELLMSCREAITDVIESAGGSPAPEDDLLVNQLLQKLRGAAAARKHAIISHYVEMSTGMQHAELIKHPQEHYRDVWMEINNLNLGADILITSVGTATQPIIIRLDRWGETHWEYNYSAIGEGSRIARAMLCLQPWDGLGWPNGENPTLPSLLQCLYRVYEAKRAAHIAHPSSVGEATGFQVLIGDEKFSLDPMFQERLDEVFNIKHRVPSDKPEDALAPILQLPKQRLLIPWDPLGLR